ncbi:MAG: 30S ribosomal protein S6 [Patescibacteria group bacterium]
MQNDTVEADIETGLVDTDENDAPQTAVYEIGYHLLPTIAEEDLAKAVSALTDALKAENAEFVGERFPSKVQLAYPITKRVNDKRTPFENAYFGWIAFSVPKSLIANLKRFLDANPSVLRYLIVKTSREAVTAAMTGATVTPSGDIGKPKRDAETGGELSEEALEQALQTIAKEDAKAAE